MSFVFTEDKYKSILNRLVALETHVNDLNVASTNLASMQQLKELLAILQASLIEVDNKLTALQNRIIAIEEEPLS